MLLSLLASFHLKRYNTTYKYKRNNKSSTPHIIGIGLVTVIVKREVRWQMVG